MPVSMPDPRDGGPPTAAVEAARYALMRRLVPSMRHHLVVNLQPIGMIHEVMDRRLRASQPDLPSLHDSADKINGFARAALASSLEVIGWLAPDEVVGTTVEAAVRECAMLLTTSLGFRGIALRNEVTQLPGQVRRCAIRSVLTSALIFTADHVQPAATIAITAHASGQGVLLRLAVRPSDGDRGFAPESGYRDLEWDDVVALAAADRVSLQREGQGLAILLPWLAPA